MIYLGVDVGFKHMGIALASGPLATPLPSFKHRSVNSSAASLISLAQTHNASIIILGLPDGPTAKLVHELVSSLSEQGWDNVVLHDETLSTKDAINKLRQAGASKKKLQNDHSYAACLILEDYLESHPN